MKLLLTLLGCLALSACSNEEGKRISVSSNILGGNTEVQAPTPHSYTHAYVLMGQSNMSRNCGNRVPNYFSVYNRGTDAGCSTGQALSDVLNDSDALYIQCAYGGTEMSRWSVGGDLYESCLRSIPSYLPVRGMFFFQGEADAINGLSVPDWSNAFQSMVQDLRARVGDIPVVYAQLGSGRNDIAWQALQAEQASISMPRVSMVMTSDLPPYDGVHYSQSSYRVIAERMGNTFKVL